LCDQAWFNKKGYHSLPTYLNTLNNAILRANLNQTTKGHPAAYGNPWCCVLTMLTCNQDNYNIDFNIEEVKIKREGGRKGGREEGREGEEECIQKYIAFVL